MIDFSNIKGLIVNEFSNSDCENWFNMTYKKFLHNIDTFYYSVNLHNDFSRETEDSSVLKMRKYFTRFQNDNFDYCEPIYIDNCNVQLNYRNFTFSGYYKHCIECPDTFDIFVAETVPTDITSEIVIQIRSMPLWLQGTVKAFEYSYNVVKSFCDMFGLQIKEVKENRVDYCWHSNAIQNPETYFRIDNFAEMQVSRFKRIHYEYQFKTNNEYENDYICLGRRSDKCFIRIYLKSKEVIEKGYKPFFIKLWLFNGLINRYDYYVYSNLFECGNWNHLDIMRLQFYSEYGKDELYKKSCLSYINKLATTGLVDYEKVHRLAELLTPKVTLITNVEFQTTRKSSKSYTLIEYPDNSKYGECKRIYDYMDNRRMITDYLTHSTLRLVDITTDSNKSRCDYVQFWKSLRSCKQIDVRISKHNIKMVRDYTRQLNKEMIKKRMMNSAMTYSLYQKGINDDDVKEDIVNALVQLNDNDLFNMRNYKYKRIKQLNNMDFSGTIEDLNRNIGLIDLESGELL